MQAAGNDAREQGEVGRDVQGEAVRRDPPRQMDADRSDLLLPHPDADVLLAFPRPSGEPVAGERANENLLKIADIAADVPTVRAEGDDRIPHELPRTVIGDLAAAIALHDLDTTGREPLR